MKIIPSLSFLPRVMVVLIVFDLALLGTWLYGEEISTRVQSLLESKNKYFSEAKHLTAQAGIWDFKDYSIYLKKLAEQKGGEYAYHVMKQAQFTEGTDMHLLGHVVSDEIYKQQGMEGIKVCDHDFRNACSHSIVVGAFLERGEDAIDEVREACYRAPGGKGAYTMCFHGLGHGVLAYVEYDMESAAEICGKMGTPQYHNRESVECVGGTVMEMMAGVNDREAWEKQKPNYLQDGKPLTPCAIDFISKEVKPVCFLYLTPRLLQLAGADLASPSEESFEKAFLFCDRIAQEEKMNRNACFGGFGKEFVVLAKNRDVRNIENMTDKELAKVYEWCLFAPHEEGLLACIEHAVNSLYWGGENNREVSIKFCSLIQDPDRKSFCFSNLIGAVEYYIDEEGYKKAFCEDIPKEYRISCEEKLKIPL